MKNRRSIRNFVIHLSIFAATFGAQSALADFSDNFTPVKFWQEVRSLVLRCSVRTVTEDHGREESGYMRSDCSELVVSGNHAQFYLRGDWYTAIVTDSEDSDGGDLNDLLVLDQHGVKIAERHNTPAFGDVLVALAGGPAQMQENNASGLSLNSQ